MRVAIAIILFFGLGYIFTIFFPSLLANHTIESSTIMLLSILLILAAFALFGFVIFNEEWQFKKMIRNMNIPTKVILTFALTVFLITALIVPLAQLQERIQGYSSHASISINGNEDFTSSRGVISGVGTFSDPYVIAGWKFKPPGNGISIKNTDNHFIIRNIFTDDSWGDGISLSDVSNGRIEKSTLRGNYNGIYLADCNNIFIINNIIASNEHIGLYIYSTTNCTITGNSISSNGLGIKLTNSTNNELYHNDFKNNERQARHYGGNGNSWDNGYPSGGNHWLDYDGADFNRDGIGDTPYLIVADGQDNYPIMRTIVTTDFPWWTLIGILSILITAMAISFLYPMRKKKPPIEPQ